jgi:hypothetical protein
MNESEEIQRRIKRAIDYGCAAQEILRIMLMLNERLDQLQAPRARPTLPGVLSGVSNVQNPNCDGSGPHALNPEVRVLPAGGESNLILCENCYAHEIAYRRSRNQSLSESAQFKLPEWKTLTVYG